jgi:APA family basic amino acid/polyamine antiporter
MKSIDSVSLEEGGHGLKRVLGPLDLTVLGIGAIVGAGIFALVGTAAAGDGTRPGAGPALVVSFLLTGIACGFTALCYAEFAALNPVSGSAYSYAYTTLGELIAWIIGWDLLLEYAVGNIAVAVSWSGYFCELLRGFGLGFPRWLATDLRTALNTPEILSSSPRLLGIPIVFNLPAVLIVTAITILLVVGIRESARFTAAMVVVKLLVLGLVVVLGFYYVRPENWRPFAPNGWAGIQAGAAVVFFAFIGFDAVSTTAEECRNPKRDLPIGILGSLGVCTVVYMVVAAVLTGIVPWQNLDTAEPLSVAMRVIGLNWAAGIVAFGSVVAHTAVLLVCQMGQPRILF